MDFSHSLLPVLSMETFWQAYISNSFSQKSTYKPNREDTKKAEVKDKGWRTVARDRRRGGRLVHKAT